MNTKFKTITTKGKAFIKRLSFYNSDGSSVKLHLILHDDLDEPHTHPWDFSSLILFGGYKEENRIFGFLDVNIKKHHEKHQLKLRRIFNIPIPTLTIGIYSPKLQLCSFCTELGYCKNKQK